MLSERALQLCQAQQQLTDFSLRQPVLTSRRAVEVAFKKPRFFRFFKKPKKTQKSKF